MDFWNVSEMDYFNCRDPFDGEEPSFSRGLANSRNPLQGRLSRANHQCARTTSQGPGLSSALSDLVVSQRGLRSLAGANLAASQRGLRSLAGANLAASHRGLRSLAGANLAASHLRQFPGPPQV